MDCLCNAIGELSKDGKRTVKPFRWIPLKDKKVPNFPDNNTHKDSDKLPEGGYVRTVPAVALSRSAATATFYSLVCILISGRWVCLQRTQPREMHRATILHQQGRCDDH